MNKKTIVLSLLSVLLNFDVYSKDNSIIFNNSISYPENILNVSYFDILSTYQGFDSESNSKSYLHYIINNYKDSYDNKNISLNIFGRDGNLIYNLNLKNSNDNSNYGFKEYICNSEINKLFLTLGVNFELNVKKNEKIINTTILNSKNSETCLLNVKKKQSQIDLNKKDIKQETTDIKQEHNKAIELIVNEQDIKEVTVLPPISMPNNTNINKSINKIDNKTKTKEKNLSKKKDTKLNNENSKLLENFIKRKGNFEENKKNITILIEDIKKEYYLKADKEKNEYTQEIVKFISNTYGKHLNREIQKDVFLSVEANKNNVNYNIKFNKLLEKEIQTKTKEWGKQNEAKNFVCSQLFLKEMLNLNISFNVKYIDKKGKVFYLENFKKNINNPNYGC